MTAEKKDRRPLHIKNLADLKRHIKLGTELVATAHQYHPDIVGLTRVVTKVQTNGFYSKIKDQPDHKWSTCNQGMGFWSPFNKAGAYHFTDSTVQVLNTRKNDGSVLYEMELYDGEQSMSEQNKEVPDMNEWDRLHRQAQRYKEAYIADVTHTLEAEQKAVGDGLIEPIDNDDGTCLVGNEESKLRGMDGNRRIGDGSSIMAGPFFVCGDAGETFRSLTDEEVTRYMARFAEPEDISPEEVEADMGFMIYPM